MYPEVPDTVCQTNTKILVPQQSHLSACCSDARVSYNLLKLQRTIEKPQQHSAAAGTVGLLRRALFSTI